jgi:hypothetical protein
MTMHRKPMNTTRDIFRMPLLIGVISTIGLASALLGNGLWDGLSWVALGVPVALTIFYWVRRAR